MYEGPSPSERRSSSPRGVLRAGDDACSAPETNTPLATEAALPDAHLLATSHEKELCSALLLAPKHYLVMRDYLLQECVQRGSLIPGAALAELQIDVRKSGSVYDFFATPTEAGAILA